METMNHRVEKIPAFMNIANYSSFGGRLRAHLLARRGQSLWNQDNSRQSNSREYILRLHSSLFALTSNFISNNMGQPIYLAARAERDASAASAASSLTFSRVRPARTAAMR